MAGVSRAVGFIGASSQYADLGAGFDFGTNDFTFSAWTLVDAVAFPLTTRGASDTKGYEILLGGGGAGTAELRFEDDATNVQVGLTSGLNDGRFHCLTGVFNATHGSFYVDGQLKGSVVRTGSLDNTQNLLLNKRGTFFGDCTVAHTMIFDYALTLAQIESLYLCGRDGQ